MTSPAQWLPFGGSMKLTNDDLQDCSRAFLEACLDSLVRQIADGHDGLLPRLGAVLAAIPNALPYSIDHRAREDRRL
jgi:hypothetical protein